MSGPFKKNASYDDLYAIPDTWVGELIDGDLYAFPRPRTTHALALGGLFGQLVQGPPDDPTGWVFMMDVEIWFGRDLLVPDVCGWRRSRLPEVPDVVSMELAPDWVCEGMSPSTARLDRGPKREIYARGGVGHIWFVDPAHHTLEVLVLDAGTYRVAQTGGDGDVGHFAPFEQPVDLAKLWRR